MRQQRDNKRDDRDFIFGIRPVMEAIESGKEINRVLIQKNAHGDLMHELVNALREHNIAFQQVPEQKLNRVTRKNHQGAIAFISPIRYQELDYIISEQFSKGGNPLILVLDRITDIRNFGAIARSAECMGAHAIVIPKKGGALINADAVKTSAGALNTMPVCRVDDLCGTLTYLSNSGLKVVGCTEKADKIVSEIDMSEPTAIVMGSEENGISPACMEQCAELGKIPMSGETGSLNVSVAAGMILYEAGRQRSVTP